MDHSNLAGSRFEVYVCKKSTGILMNLETLNRWSSLSGGDKLAYFNSLQEARQFALKIVSTRIDLEAVIYDFQAGVEIRVDYNSLRDG